MSLRSYHYRSPIPREEPGLESSLKNNSVLVKDLVLAVVPVSLLLARFTLVKS